MTSDYQILNDRPIDQWKVTALKEELKRRKLRTAGLKEELVKRLDEAVRIEREAVEKPTVVVPDSDSQPATSVGEAVTVNAEINVETCDVTETSPLENSEAIETTKNKNAGTSNQDNIEMNEKENVGRQDDVSQGSDKHELVDIVKVNVDINASESVVDQEKVPKDGLQVTENSSTVGEVLASLKTGADTGNNIVESETHVSETLVTHQGSQDSENEERTEIGVTNRDIENSDLTQTSVHSVPHLENEDSEASEDSKLVQVSDGSMIQMQFDSKLSDEDLLHDPSAPKSQVSEVNPILGSQVKSDSVPTDSLSINENIELKDNIITDNVKLEQDNIRIAMVELSPSNVVPVADETSSINVDEPHEKKAPVGEKNDHDNKAARPDLKKTSSSEDMVYPEKLNLDRSSGEDSMDEDLQENKRLDSKYSLDELKEKSENSKVPITKEKCSDVTLPEGLYAKKNDDHVDNDSHPSASAEKRKIPDQAAIRNNEPSKRQRRWNDERVKVANSQKNNFTNTSATVTALKEIPTSGTRSFSRSDSSVNDEACKERIVPPSEKTPTNSLKINGFLRPFTLKAVHELLGKTGTVTEFWMDHIKTHCYVTFSSEEEAILTRNAVYNLQWPPNGGRLLVAQFVNPQEVKMKVEPSSQDTPTHVDTSVSSAPTAPKSVPSPRQPRQHHQMQLPPPPFQNELPPSSTEKLPSRQPVPEKAEPVTLDDLFRKTKATPRIYYLPLSEEQVAVKLAVQSKTTKH